MKRIFKNGNIFILFGSVFIATALFIIVLMPVNAMMHAHNETGLDGLVLTPYKSGTVGDVDKTLLDPDRYLTHTLPSKVTKLED